MNLTSYAAIVPTVLVIIPFFMLCLLIRFLYLFHDRNPMPKQSFDGKSMSNNTPINMNSTGTSCNIISSNGTQQVMIENIGESKKTTNNNSSKSKQVNVKKSRSKSTTNQSVIYNQPSRENIHSNFNNNPLYSNNIFNMTLNDQLAMTNYLQSYSMFNYSNHSDSNNSIPSVNQPIYSNDAYYMNGNNNAVANSDVKSACIANDGPNDTVYALDNLNDSTYDMINITSLNNPSDFNDLNFTSLHDQSNDILDLQEFSPSNQSITSPAINHNYPMKRKFKQKSKYLIHEDQVEKARFKLPRKEFIKCLFPSDLRFSYGRIFVDAFNSANANHLSNSLQSLCSKDCITSEYFKGI